MPTPFESSRKAESGPRNDKARRSVFANFQANEQTASFPADGTLSADEPQERADLPTLHKTKGRASPSRRAEHSVHLPERPAGTDSPYPVHDLGECDKDKETFLKPHSRSGVSEERRNASPRNPAALCGDDKNLEVPVARTFIYRFLAVAFEIPNAENWRWLRDSATRSALRAASAQAFEAESGPPGTKADELISHLAEASFEAFESAYYAAFGHTVRGDCPMNEIEYGDIKADPLFQPHRLADLGAFYRAFGLEVAGDAAERQDHVCLELEFMAVLAAKEAYAGQEELGAEPFAVCREAQRKFLREHLGRWTPAFTRRLAATAGPGALAALADFTREFVVSDCRRLGVPPGSEDLLLRPVDEAAETLCHSCGINQLPPGAAVPAGS